MKKFLGNLVKLAYTTLIYFLFSAQLFASEIKPREYILGVGDELLINFEGLEIFSNNYIIQADGNIFLPEVESIKAENKTLKELKEILIKEYDQYIYEPDIELIIKKYKPALVTLRGEVNKTGLFEMKYLSVGDSPENTYLKPPKLFDLIKLGEGFTTYSDLSNIKIIRKNHESAGGGKIEANLNLLSLITEGDQSQNINLFDGDDVFIGKNENILIDQLLELNKSNITPSNVEVFINGNINIPGRLIIKQGSSLYEAISAAGGKKNQTGTIQFIRLNRNGKSDKRILRYNENAKKGTFKNPILISGDIIHVKMNLVGKTTKAITEYTAPLVNSYAIYKIFEN